MKLGGGKESTGKGVEMGSKDRIKALRSSRGEKRGQCNLQVAPPKVLKGWLLRER